MMDHVAQSLSWQFISQFDGITCSNCPVMLLPIASLDQSIWNNDYGMGEKRFFIFSGIFKPESATLTIKLGDYSIWSPMLEWGSWCHAAISVAMSHGWLYLINYGGEGPGKRNKDVWVRGHFFRDVKDIYCLTSELQKRLIMIKKMIQKAIFWVFCDIFAKLPNSNC